MKASDWNMNTGKHRKGIDPWLTVVTLAACVTAATWAQPSTSHAAPTPRLPEVGSGGKLGPSLATEATQYRTTRSDRLFYQSAINQFESVVVFDFVGSKARRARMQVVKKIKNAGLTVIPLRKAAHEAMVEGALEIKGTRRAEIQGSANAVAVARKLGASAFITGEMYHRHGKWTVHVDIISGEDGKVLGSWRANASTNHELYHRIQRDFWDKLDKSTTHRRARRLSSR